MYRHSRSLLARLYPGMIAGKDGIERTARLITEFSQAGLRGLKTLQEEPHVLRKDA